MRGRLREIMKGMRKNFHPYFTNTTPSWYSPSIFYFRAYFWRITWNYFVEGNCQLSPLALNKSFSIQQCSFGSISGFNGLIPDGSKCDDADQYKGNRRADINLVPEVFVGKSLDDDVLIFLFGCCWLIAIFGAPGSYLILDRRRIGYYLVFIAIFIALIAQITCITGYMPWDWWRCLRDNQEQNQSGKVQGWTHRQALIIPKLASKGGLYCVGDKFHYFPNMVSDPSFHGGGYSGFGEPGRNCTKRRSAELFFSEKNYSAVRHGELNSS